MLQSPKIVIESRKQYSESALAANDGGRTWTHGDAWGRMGTFVDIVPNSAQAKKIR
jgi:hypothetical protein